MAYELYLNKTAIGGFPDGSAVKNLIQSLGREDLLEKEIATHSNILAGKMPWTEEPGGLQSKGSKESDTTKQQSMHAKQLFKKLGPVHPLCILCLKRFLNQNSCY